MKGGEEEDEDDEESQRRSNQARRDGKDGCRDGGEAPPHPEHSTVTVVSVMLRALQRVAKGGSGSPMADRL